jgi:hypothetical protein
MTIVEEIPEIEFEVLKPSSRSCLGIRSTPVGVSSINGTGIGSQARKSSIRFGRL